MGIQLSWDDELRETVRAMWEQKWTDAEIAEELDTTPSIIKARRKELGLATQAITHTDEELLIKLKACRFLGALNNPGETVYIKRFGSMANACRLAKATHLISKYTDEELLEILKKSDNPTYNYFNNSANNTPSAVTYVKRFGSWASALERAGLQPNKVGLKPYEGTTVYLVDFGECYKIGITQQSLDDRLAGYPDYSVVFTLDSLSLSEAKLVEKSWLENVKEFKVFAKNFPRNRGYSECFKYT